MGIYPDERWERKSETEWVRVVTTPGLEVRETFQRTLRIENRDNCFCCSCPEYGTDVYCRNHGWAGTRPCEDHNMPGQKDEEGVMPGSVQSTPNYPRG